MAVSKTMLLAIVFSVALISLVITLVELPSGHKIMLKVPSGYDKARVSRHPVGLSAMNAPYPVLTAVVPQLHRGKRRPQHLQAQRVNRLAGSPQGLIELPEAPSAEDEDTRDPYQGAQAYMIRYSGSNQTALGWFCFRFERAWPHASARDRFTWCYRCMLVA
jgi:hypothetical protein